VKIDKQAIFATNPNKTQNTRIRSGHQRTCDKFTEIEPQPRMVGEIGHQGGCELDTSLKNINTEHGYDPKPFWEAKAIIANKSDTEMTI
jgi:hypothetical protein